MNYSFMTFSCPELTLDEVLSLATELGYTGIEPRLGSGHKHGVEIDTDSETRNNIKEKVAQSGIELACLATSCKYADPETVQENIETTQKTIELAAAIDCPRIRVFGGVIPDGISREDAISAVTEALKTIADTAEKHKVTVCFETHDHWCDPKHVAEVIKRVDNPYIAVNWDIMHPVRIAKVTMDDAFNTLKPWIRHLHVHDGITTEDGGLVMKPIGEGIIDHRRALELLTKNDYQGYISGEWINWEPYETHLPRELAIMKKYEQEIGNK